jgi:ABC-type maltose transport system permease subunit
MLSMAERCIGNVSKRYNQMVDASMCLVCCFNTSNTSEVLKPEKPSPAIQHVVTCIITTGYIIGFVSVLLNGIYLIIHYFTKDKTLAYYHLIRSLVIADIFASVTFFLTQVWPHGPFAHINPQEHFALAHGLSYMFRGTPWLFFTAYLLTLSCLTVNQYIAVCKPWCYSELAIPCRVYCCLAFIWLLSSMQLLIPLFIILSLLNIEDKKEAMGLLYQVAKVEMHLWMTLFIIAIICNIVFSTNSTKFFFF